MTIRVMLVDDHRMFVEALKQSLRGEPDIAVVGVAYSGKETLAALDRDRPDVLVLDIGLRDMNGAEVARHVAKRHPSVRTIALSGHDERPHIEEMLKAGAQAYVVKSGPAQDLISAIRTVAAGHTYLSPEVTQVMVRRFHEDLKGTAPPPTVLGKRERDVLRLLAEGKRSSEICRDLGIALTTVDAHRRNIKQKLGLHSIAELTRYALHEGIIAP